MCQRKMRFSFPHRDICTTKWAVCVCVTRGRLFFSDHKMNHEAAEEFHNLCVKSGICDLDDWSQPGTATLLPPRGSDNKTQLLGKIIAGGTRTSHLTPAFYWPWKASTCQRTPAWRAAQSPGIEEESPFSSQTCSSSFASSAPSST